MVKHVTAFSFLLTAAALAALVGCTQKDLNNNAEQDLPDYNTSGEVKNMDDYPDLNNNNSELPSGQKEPALELIVGLEEISRDAYIKRFGEESLRDDPALSHAERFAAVTINPELFEADYLSNLQYLSLTLFDDQQYTANIESSAFYGNTFSTSWRIEGFEMATMTLSTTEKQLVASLKFPKEKVLYLINYKKTAEGHFLYKIFTEQIEPFECTVLHPQENNNDEN